MSKRAFERECEVRYNGPYPREQSGEDLTVPRRSLLQPLLSSRLPPSLFGNSSPPAFANTHRVYLFILPKIRSLIRENSGDSDDVSRKTLDFLTAQTSPAPGYHSVHYVDTCRL
eukprot:1193847-Prorocentrum_minimum.AAC.4